MHKDKVLEKPQLVSQPKYTDESLTKRIRLSGGTIKPIQQCTEQEFQGYLKALLSQMYQSAGYVTRAYTKYFGDLDLQNEQDRVQALNEMEACIEQRKIDCSGRRKIEVNLFVDDAEEAG